MSSLHTSILFWVLFDDLRPYLAKQYMINNGNEVQRLTMDEFFTQRLYSSYLLGDNNMFGRMLLDYEKMLPKDGDEVDEKKFEAYVKKEQKRIETELLNFEQDLWEY